MVWHWDDVWERPGNRNPAMALKDGVLIQCQKTETWNSPVPWLPPPDPPLPKDKAHRLGKGSRPWVWLREQDATYTELPSECQNKGGIEASSCLETFRLHSADLRLKFRPAAFGVSGNCIPDCESSVKLWNRDAISKRSVYLQSPCCSHRGWFRSLPSAFHSHHSANWLRRPTQKETAFGR